MDDNIDSSKNNSFQGKNRKKQKIISTNCIRRSLSSNKPSRGNDTAKIQIKREIAIGNLKELQNNYTNSEQIYGFLTNLKKALCLNDTNSPSEYGVVIIPQNSGEKLSASISISNLHANAQTYIDKESNYEYNLRIVVKKTKVKGKFRANIDVILDEFEYTGKELRKVSNSLSLIIQSIIGFMETGEYIDLTGIAIKHHSPDLCDN